MDDVSKRHDEILLFSIKQTAKTLWLIQTTSHSSFLCVVRPSVDRRRRLKPDDFVFLEMTQRRLLSVDKSSRRQNPSVGTRPSHEDLNGGQYLMSHSLSVALEC